MPKGIPNKKYTGEFKQMVVEAMQKEGLSYREAARQYEIRDHKQVAKWERIYLEMKNPKLIQEITCNRSKLRVKQGLSVIGPRPGEFLFSLSAL